jgi:hypothetical protein
VALGKVAAISRVVKQSASGEQHVGQSSQWVGLCGGDGRGPEFSAAALRAGFSVEIAASSRSASLTLLTDCRVVEFAGFAVQ